MDGERAITVRSFTIFSHPPLARPAGFRPKCITGSVRSPETGRQPDGRSSPAETGTTRRAYCC